MKPSSLSVSSIHTFDHCEHKFMISSILGYREDAGNAALLGTIFHKYFEIRAKSVLTKGLVDDKLLGEVDATDARLVQAIFDKYGENKFGFTDIQNTENLIKKTLAFNNGAYDPFKMDVVDVEKWFEIQVGDVKLRGVIDLVTKLDDRTLLAIDWKTAAKLNDFHSGQPITEESLYKDPQIRIYVWAMYKLFDVDNVIFTIYFVKHNKPFTIIIEKDEGWKVEKYIDIKYKKIMKVEKPKPFYSWKCKMCSHSKKQFGESGQTLCDYFKERVEIDGMESTIANYQVKK